MNPPLILEECTYQFVRSGGKGGQNVNKVASKVLLVFDLPVSRALTDEEKQTLLLVLEKKLTKEQKLNLTCETSRSQWENKELVNKKLLDLLTKSLVKKKKRVPTKVSKKQKAKRVDNKKIHADKKQNRKKIIL